MAMTRDCGQTLEVTPTLYNLSQKFQFKLAVKFYQGGRNFDNIGSESSLIENKRL